MIWFGNLSPTSGVSAVTWFSLPARFQYYRFASFRFGKCFGSQDMRLDHVVHVKEVGQGLSAKQRHHQPILCHFLQNMSDSINVKLKKDKICCVHIVSKTYFIDTGMFQYKRMNLSQRSRFYTQCLTFFKKSL